MKISMIPNKIVKLIHASKGDTSLRKWAFEPYDNNGAISVSNIKDQLVYQTENGGTEQLLPVNTSTPTTSYFDGTINYGTDTDVEFTYKQSSYTGKARVKSVKGNTLCWNQLVDSGTTSVTLTSGHVYITKVGTTWSRVSGTGQSISVTGGSDCVFDLTKMYKSGNEPTLDEFRSLFPLNYYAYNSGSLLNFNGTGIKTTGKNYVTNYLSDSTTANISWTQTDGVVTFSGKANGTTRTPSLTSAISLKKGSYILSGSKGGSNQTYGLRIQGYVNGSWVGIGINDNYDTEVAFTLNEDMDIRVVARFSNVQTTDYDVTMYPMIRLSGTDSTFEPYTSSTLSLHISTYFPTGMKSAGSVYDELSDKAITRVGSVDLGSLTWTYASGSWSCFTTNLPTKKVGETNMTMPIYSIGAMYGTTSDKIYFGNMNSSAVYIRDNSFSGDASAFKTAMSGVYLNYELATYTETDIQNASLVCKNIEVPCYLSSGNLVCDATEELTSESGFFDAKLKLKDSSSVAYSSKFKLHVEDL